MIRNTAYSLVNTERSRIGIETPAGMLASSHLLVELPSRVYNLLQSPYLVAFWRSKGNVSMAPPTRLTGGARKKEKKQNRLTSTWSQVRLREVWQCGFFKFQRCFMIRVAWIACDLSTFSLLFFAKTVTVFASSPQIWDSPSLEQPGPQWASASSSSSSPCPPPPVAIHCNWFLPHSFGS